MALTGTRLLAAKALLKTLTEPRNVATSVLEVAGLALVAVGFFRMSTTIGLIVTGCALFVLGVASA